MDFHHKKMASSAGGKANNRGNAGPDSAKCHEVSQSREMVKPTITELTKEVRTNILCTVEGCGKILPNTPALNMHLVKSHRIKVKSLKKGGRLSRGAARTDNQSESFMAEFLASMTKTC